MSEFELGVMAGWVAGVVTAGAIAGALDWWSERNRVVAVPVEAEPCAPVAQDDAFGGKDVIIGDGMIRCPKCDGCKVVSNGKNGHLRIRGPQTILCDCCKGLGVIYDRPFHTKW